MWHPYYNMYAMYGQSVLINGTTFFVIGAAKQSYVATYRVSLVAFSVNCFHFINQKLIQKCCRSCSSIVCSPANLGHALVLSARQRGSWQFIICLDKSLKMHSFLNLIFLISFHLIPSLHYVNPILQLSLSV